MKIMATSIRIPVHVNYDATTKDWHYHARIGADIGVVGGGLPSLESARQAAAESIAYALEAAVGSTDSEEVEFVPVAVG